MEQIQAQPSRPLLMVMAGFETKHDIIIMEIRTKFTPKFMLCFKTLLGVWGCSFFKI